MHIPFQLDAERQEALRAEIDTKRRELVADLGERDTRYIRRVMRVSRLLSIGGRSLLMFSFFNPYTWIAGVLSLAVAKILENMEIGHNVMHGQYDWTGDPRLDSRTYDWDNVCAAQDWKQSHNVKHHDLTNIVGRDPDFGYGVLRLTDAVPWHRRSRAQLVLGLTTTLIFEWAVGIHDAEPEAVRDGRISFKQFVDRLGAFGRKLRRQAFKDYLLFPALALLTGHALGVLAGNALANLIRNIWSAVIIFCGHFPQQTRIYSIDETANESRGAWYARQIEGSCNIEGGWLLYVMSGYLSHQIEHHVFPDIPSHRYTEIQPWLKDLCKRYGLQYNTGSLPRQYWSVVRRVARYSARPKPATGALPA
ncbi:MAG: putative fatty acid desaturase [Hydrocarboniphaga sp.]|uniref:fatty acid desaturase family protein n=1 Tax=Hydrocarboniphaga sp. TaxID=2033016 RepID=UPI00260FB146|nr:acyl-CoA desaturase [Hydrocarboniphaga sp.]MDB5972128.1 putative fatty acid desaturase [Hydrocarboniphaga sp.]